MNVESVITILGFLGIPSIIAVVYGFNSMMLMDPVSFTFEESDKREKYVILRPIGSASFALFILAIAVFILVTLSYTKVGKDAIGLAFLTYIIFFVCSCILLVINVLLFVINLFLKFNKHILGIWLQIKLCNSLLLYFSGLFLIAYVIVCKLSVSFTDIQNQKDIILGWKVSLLLGTLLIVGAYTYIVYKLYSKYISIINLSYLYYKEGNEIVFLFNRVGDSWLCSSKRDYIRCSTEEKKAFKDKIRECKKDTNKKVTNKDGKSQILEYIEKLNRYSDYIRVGNEVIKDYLNIITRCICDSGVNIQIQNLHQKIDLLDNIIELKLISNDEISKKTLCHHLDNKDIFYNM
ncbi:hypothetical protein HMPREF1495_2446 [Lachnoanaerobaculum sp. MSX33]|uniref:hypothetical protein n=1 Tax=Lachnoanaerobaculum sp. MSX33 TaxID=936596 RepID=UPI0003DF8B32|nr:hypothetical protein [Lachnoanaerobaculum sp. MSX33]ETO97518.1 hypothetical protein HMPREF1495_2446 [Lachnoanaerobaculum sp. MSX33]